MAHSIYVFDAYGTLFDVHAAVRRHADEVGPEGQLLSALWRAKQLEYSWMLTMMGRYRDFWSLTEEALDYAFARVPQANRASRAALLDSYWTCDVYPDVPEVIKQLKMRGVKLVILSNGTPQMLRAACRSAGIEDEFDDIICRSTTSRSTSPIRASTIWSRPNIGCSRRPSPSSRRTAGTPPVPPPSASARCGSTATACRKNTTTSASPPCCRAWKG